MKKDDNGNVVGTKRVVWHLTNDALQPTPTPYGFVARNPLARAVPPNGKIQINLQVQANVPLIAFPTRPHVDDVTVPMLIQPGQDIVVTIENRSQHSPLLIEDKEGLVGLFPLVFDGVGEVG